MVSNLDQNSTATRMKAWQYTDVSTTLEAALKLDTSYPVPNPASLPNKSLLIKVLAAGINPVDYKLPESGVIGRVMIGRTAGPGLDFCGRVVASMPPTPSGMFQKDQLVFGCMQMAQKIGTLSEYVVVSKDECAPLLDGMSIDQAAALGTAALTAWQSMLPEVVKLGAHVLINGGSGGVGTMAIQFAKAKGAHVTTTCSTNNVSLCRSLGADEVWDYRSMDINAKLQNSEPVFDIVIDNVGSIPYQGCETYLKPHGCYVTVGVSAVNFSGIAATIRHAIVPSFLGGGRRKYHFVQVKSNTKDLVAISELIAAGKVHPVIERSFAMEDVPEAFTKLREGRTKGKILIRVADS